MEQRKELDYKTTVLSSGHVVQVPQVAPAEWAYIQKLKNDALNTAVSYDDMIARIYSKENPVMNQSVFDGAGAVTREVADNPFYHLMLDLLERKAIQKGMLDPSRDFARYSMTVQDAAKTLGLHDSVVRTAITKRRLAARKITGKWMLNPSDVDNYQVSKNRHLKSGRR